MSANARELVSRIPQLRGSENLTLWRQQLLFALTPQQLSNTEEFISQKPMGLLGQQMQQRALDSSPLLDTAQFASFPAEILLQINGCLSEAGDENHVAQVSKRFHHPS
ncbi:hypothetical protein B0T24DRAFT_673889 [Lasiosphaeria ovina]|uniref:F-box domain-containing protein n=1 Tax=Lasiosphaeria ovina TaxID=92902 RepID=A0AAE0TYD7_9PEZI|nr:hypothetical protein B0T24DRAFT_673889 [Lasiosphaeria ovina]